MMNNFAYRHIGVETLLESEICDGQSDLEEKVDGEEYVYPHLTSLINCVGVDREFLWEWKDTAAIAEALIDFANFV